jgi:hypothetical protein
MTHEPRQSFGLVRASLILAMSVEELSDEVRSEQKERRLSCGTGHVVPSVRISAMNSQAQISSRWQARSSWMDAVDAGELETPAMREPVPGDFARSVFAGGVAGALGGVIALGAACAVFDRARLVEQTRVAVGYASSLSVTAGSLWLRVGCAVIAGMLLGAALGGLTRRLHGRLGRLVFGAVLVPALWIAVDAFALVRFAPRLAAFVPFLPGLVAAVVFGICATLVRPILPRWVRSEVRPSATGTASFPLVRRRS